MGDKMRLRGGVLLSYWATKETRRHVGVKVGERGRGGGFLRQRCPGIRASTSFEPNLLPTGAEIPGRWALPAQYNGCYAESVIRAPVEFIGGEKGLGIISLGRPGIS